MTSRTNAEWLGDLKAGGQAQELALADLRQHIVRGLPYALMPLMPGGGAALAELVEETAQETLLRVLDRLAQFEGRSQFTTWASKIAVRLALTELRRRKWRDISLDEVVAAGAGEDAMAVMTDGHAGPERLAERGDITSKLRLFISEELTERQRRAMLGIVMSGMPMDVMADQLQMDRNALYKLMHDGRLKLKLRLIREGLLTVDTLSAFEDR